jgi:hypothetical protein
MEEGLSRLTRDAHDLYEEARATIQRARDATDTLLREGVIPAPPE